MYLSKKGLPVGYNFLHKTEDPVKFVRTQHTYASKHNYKLKTKIYAHISEEYTKVEYIVEGEILDVETDKKAI